MCICNHIKMYIGTSLVVWWIRLHASNSGDPVRSLVRGFLGESGHKESACRVAVPGSIPGSIRHPEEGNGKPVHYSCLENPMDGGTWQATVHQTTELEWLSDFTFFQGTRSHRPQPKIPQLSKGVCLTEFFWNGFSGWMGWDGWMASLKWGTRWACSRSWRWTGKPGVLQSMGSQSVGHDWATELKLKDPTWHN